MKVNATKVIGLRKKRSWSQDELATAAGLNLRTIQRIENEGTALEADLENLRVTPEEQMNTSEYKTRPSSDARLSAAWRFAECHGADDYRPGPTP